MNIAKVFFGAGLLTTNLLVGCSVDAENESLEPPVSDEGQPLISYDTETSTYRFEAGSLQAAELPCTVAIDGELRGAIETPDAVLEVSGVEPDATIHVQPRDQSVESVEKLKPGESVELNQCSSYFGENTYCCGGYDVKCISSWFGDYYCWSYCTGRCLYPECYGYS